VVLHHVANGTGRVVVLLATCDVVFPWTEVRIWSRTQASVDGKAVSRTTNEVENRYDEKLFELLRKKRKELADRQGIPPYVIFPDTTLMELSYYFPQDEEKMMGIYGVGSAKIKKYGAPFLKIIREFCAENNVDERLQADEAAPKCARVARSCRSRSTARFRARRRRRSGCPA
jgi:ribonuclease D